MPANFEARSRARLQPWNRIETRPPYAPARRGRPPRCERPGRNGERVMINAAIVERLRYDAEQASGFRSPLARIETLAYEIGQTAPAAMTQASEILALAGVVKECGPTRDEIVEAVEGGCGGDPSGCCVGRMPEAVVKLVRR